MNHKLLKPDFPFSPARVPFFYGWVIVVVATVGVVMSVPGQTAGVSVFTDHLIAATGLDRLELSGTYMVGTLLSSVLLPTGGTLLDRWGARTLTLASCVVLSLTLWTLSSVPTIAEMGARALGLSRATLPAALLLTGGFTLLRFSGQGVLTMCSRTMLSKWFQRRRGLATGISGVFVAFAFASAPPVFKELIDASDWRAAWRTLAVAVGLGMTVVAYLFFRDNPEECGLTMDGGAPPQEAGSAAAASRPEPRSTRREAVATAGFWFVTGTVSLNAMVFTGITFHIVDLGESSGFGGDDAVYLLLPIAAVSTLCGLLFGGLADRVSVRSLALTMYSMQVLSFCGAANLQHPAAALLTVVTWGASGGLFTTLLSVALPNYFGRQHLGAISSVQVSCMVAASALGPTALAWARAVTGSYSAALYGSAVLAACGLALTAVSRAPAQT